MIALFTGNRGVVALEMSCHGYSTAEFKTDLNSVA